MLQIYSGFPTLLKLLSMLKSVIFIILLPSYFTFNGYLFILTRWLKSEALTLIHGNSKVKPPKARIVIEWVYYVALSYSHTHTHTLMVFVGSIMLLIGCIRMHLSQCSNTFNMYENMSKKTECRHFFDG